MPLNICCKVSCIMYIILEIRYGDPAKSVFLIILKTCFMAQQICHQDSEDLTSFIGPSRSVMMTLKT